jgi:hypothetical protein
MTLLQTSTTQALPEEIFNDMPLDHLIGISLLIAILVGMVLTFSWKVIKEISKRNSK